MCVTEAVSKSITGHHDENVYLNLCRGVSEPCKLKPVWLVKLYACTHTGNSLVDNFLFRAGNTALGLNIYIFWYNAALLV